MVNRVQVAEEQAREVNLLCTIQLPSTFWILHNIQVGLM